MSINIQFVVNLIIYGIGIASIIGLWIALGFNVQRSRERFKLNRQMRLKSYNRKWIKYPFVKYYHFLLSSAFKKYELRHLSKVILTQFIVFFITTVSLLFILKDFAFTLSISIILVYVLPIGYLYMIHKYRQSILQNELIESSVVLLQEYQKNHFHMLYTLKSVSGQMNGWTQIIYAQLFARMHDDDEMKELAAENFAFQVGYFRGKNLASIILRACKDGVQVITSLEDLVEDLTEFNKRIRDAETESRETAVIGFAPLPALIILYFINDKWLIPGGDTFYYQFQTPQGLKSFLVAVIFGIIGIGLGFLVRKPKKM